MHTILGFSGVKPVAISNYGPVKSSTLTQREKWLAQARGSGALRREGQGWRITQYVMSLPVPNELAKELVEKIRARR